MVSTSPSAGPAEPWDISKVSGASDVIQELDAALICWENLSVNADLCSLRV